MPDGLNILQASFSEQHALQCGFCTPGFLMSATYLLSENADPDEKAIRKALGGNVCRCTGYLPIIQAVQAAAAKMKAAATMKINLNGDFEVSASPEETFAFITTPNRFAPVLPYFKDVEERRRN